MVKKKRKKKYKNTGWEKGRKRRIEKIGSGDIGGSPGEVSEVRESDCSYPLGTRSRRVVGSNS